MPLRDLVESSSLRAITSSSVRSIGTIKARSRNVIGVSNFVSITSNIQVHSESQSGISEIAIDVSDSLGNGSLTDDGVRTSAVG